MVDRAGQLIGNYRLERHIASGGMADIYLARHTYLQRQVAVKILHAGMQEREQSAFVQEAQLIATLEHPHIVPIYDFGIDNSNPPPFAYLIMEYATGSLEDRYPSGTRVPFATIRSHVADVASALYYAHKRDIIHRDVKPQNILVSGSGTILLSDFGIATLRDTHDEHTIAGTPTFMAPEQIAGRIFTPAIDQYALGIVVYQWLCGYPPFIDNDITRLLVKQLYEQPPSLLARVPSLPAEAENVVFKALAKKPEERFPTVIEFSKALDAAFESVFKRSYIPQPSGQQDTSDIPDIPTAPFSVSPDSAQSEQQTPSSYTPAPAIPTTEPPASISPYPIWNQTPIWGTSPLFSSQQDVNSPSLPLPIQPGTNPWGQIEPPGNSGYLVSGPPTITGYAPPAGITNPYIPSPQSASSASMTGITTTPAHPLLHFLALLMAPFAFIGRVIVHRVPPSGQQGQSSTSIASITSITSITSFNTIPAFGVAGGQATMHAGSPGTTRKDFFIVYNRQDEQDRQWAGWIAWHLESSGFTVIHPDWDFHAGTNFDMEITKASSSAERVIVILSPAYFSTHDSLRRLKRDVSGKQDTIIPVIVHPLNDSFNHPLKGLVAINLAGLDKQTAQARLLSVVRKERQKPQSEPDFPLTFPAQTAWGQPAQPAWEQTLPPQPSWGQSTQINPLAIPWLPPTTTQPGMGNDASTKIMPAASLIPQINDRRNQYTDASSATVILPVSVFTSLLAARSSNTPNFDQDNTIIGTPPLSGGQQMSIEQDALKIADFLQALQDMVITNPEFGKIYTEAGRMDDQITVLSTALKTNLQLLQEARQDVRRNPGMRQYQEAVNNHLQGLSASTSDIKRLWKTFRAETLPKIQDVTQKVEQENKLLEEGQAQAVATPVGSSDTSDSTGQTKAQRRSWIKMASDGLNQFTSFLTLATDIDRAATQWSPVLLDAFKHSLEMLSQLHIF